MRPPTHWLRSRESLQLTASEGGREGGRERGRVGTSSICVCYDTNIYPQLTNKKNVFIKS